jgi:putative membrane protein
MQYPVLSAALFALLLSCSSNDDRRGGDTGMADSAPGGIGSRDTMQPVMGDSAGRSAADATTPAGILSQLNVANTMEIQLATLAAKQAASPDVKQVARKMAADHARNREQVRALAQKLDVTLTPAQGGSLSAADSVALPRDLQGKSGADFDRAFIQHEINDHQSNIQKIETQMLSSAQDPQLKSYLQKTVTEMQSHLASLEQVQERLGG